jgi:hypothetical protein
MIFSVACAAQIKGVVRDSVSGKPVALANLQVKGGTMGTTSESDGSFRLEAKKTDSVVVAALGYDSKTVLAAQVREIKLIPAMPVRSINAESPIHSKKLEIGGLSKRHHAHSAGQAPWIYARKFEYNPSLQATPFLETATIYTDAWKSGATVRLRIFGVDPSGCPGEDLLLESVTVTVKGGARETDVDLSEYKIKMPKNGLFVAVEWLLVDGNKYKFNYLNSATGKPVKSFRYDPALQSNLVDKSNGYQYSGGRWHRLDDVQISGLPKGGKQKIEPALKLALTN